MAQLTLNLVQGAVIFNFTPEAAQQLQSEISTLMQSLKSVANRTPGGGSRPTPQKSMEYQ